MIYTHAQWQTKRNAAGVKSGITKGVNMGALLDAYHNAGAGLAGQAAMLARVTTLTPLGNGLKKYKLALHPSTSRP